MTVRYTADVFCDKCGRWVHGLVSDKSTGLARPALQVAKRDGWSRDVKSLYTDLCPSCLDEQRRVVPNAKVSG